MAKRRRSRKNEEDILVDIVDVRDNAQSFFEKNQMKVIGIAGFLVILIAAYLAFQMLYQQPREKTAMTQMFKAEYQFQQDSFALALEGPGAEYPGLLDIIDEYSGTKASNLAKYYAGVCYLNLNRFEDALTYLQGYDASGNVTTITKHGAIGDAQSELEDYQAALKSYQKAASRPVNQMLTPYYLQKVGLLANKLNDKDTATKAFKRITDEFPKSEEAMDANKYLALLR